MYFPPDFDLARSLELARLVTQAYDQLEAFQRGSPWTPRDGYSLVRELVQESSSSVKAKIHSQFEPELRLTRRRVPAKSDGFPVGFIARKRNDVHVVFRGTVTVAEWARNLNVRLSDYLREDFGRVHEGFLETYTIIRQELLAALEGLDPAGRLFLTGHSLGGALATLALPDVATNSGFRSPTLYTFGSPRVGDNRFCQSFNRMFASRSFRVVNTSDMIVSLPPPVPLFGLIGGYFSHTETPVDFTTQKDDLEGNHVMGTYLSALLAARRDRGLVGRVLGWRLAGKDDRCASR